MSEQGSKDVFLSHNWGNDSLGRDNHNRVLKLNEALKKAHVKTWVDAEHLSFSIGQEITDGIDSCEQVAIFVTRRYIDKVATRYGLEDNCRKEFDYSARRKGIKNLIPIVMEPECLNLKNWNGVLGATLADVLYINYTEDGNLDACVTAIMRKLNAGKLNDEIKLEHGTYKGPLNDKKKPHGFGHMFCNDGSTYDGLWTNGKMEGKNGIFKFTNGDTYQGDFVNEQFHGKGVYTDKNGDIYEGDFVKGNLEGHGKHILVTKEVAYKGDYKQGKPHGKGALIGIDGDGDYIGQFKSGKKHGIGAKIFPGVGEYNGNWDNDNMQGKGTFTYYNGDFYEGEFQNNSMHGQAEYRYSDGAIYRGQYKEGTKFGQGKYSFKDRKQSYSGEWKNNEMNGKGVRVYNNGDTYNGFFYENKREGEGEMKFVKSNLVYNGEWHNDNMHGKGSVNVENCRDKIKVRVKKWRNNPRKLKDLDVRFEEGSLTTACTKRKIRKHRNIFGRKNNSLPGFVSMDEEDGSVIRENLTVFSGKTY